MLKKILQVLFDFLSLYTENILVCSTHCPQDEQKQALTVVSYMNAGQTLDFDTI